MAGGDRRSDNRENLLSMDVKNRLGRSLAASGVALFLVSGAVLGANAIASAPARHVDANLTTSDESAAPSADATGTAEPSESPDASETPDATASAGPTRGGDDHDSNAAQEGQQGDQQTADPSGKAGDASNDDATETAEPTETPDATETEGGNSGSGGGSDSSGGD